MRFLGGEGPAVKFVPCAREDAMDAGDDELELLLEDGWRPEDVALLTTGTRHPEQKERRAAGNAGYWDSFWDAEQVFYGHVLGFKGLERRAVVLVVNEESAFERSRERLTSDCPVPVTNSWCAATQISSGRSADPTSRVD
jgi:hypothetical protein